jgi:hypothetical protein
VDTEPTPPAHSGYHMVHLDPKYDRPVSQYSPEGEIRMMGELASGLRRRGAVSRPMAIILMVLILAPIVVSLLAVLSSR